MKKRISVIFGTRPEAIKLCPLILRLMGCSEFEVNVCVTAQHRQMLDQVTQLFSVVPDTDLDLMQPKQNLAVLTSNVVTKVYDYLKHFRPDIVLVQGDTTTVMASALAAFYLKIKIGHVEAGLRTGNLYSPWPEEGNRKITGHLANYHFCPTSTSKTNLLHEGIAAEKIFITGNTVIDALLMVEKMVTSNPPIIEQLPEYLQPATIDGPEMILITGHRRENFGEGFINICEAISQLAEMFPKVFFVYPVHLNPEVRKPVYEILMNNYCSNIILIDPLNYINFVAMMKRSKIILTDSGGVQEEAPSLGKPVLVMRDTTERPEAVSAGTVKLVGTDKSKIISEMNSLLSNEKAYAQMAQAKNPYGDGNACENIVKVLKQHLK